MISFLIILILTIAGMPSCSGSGSGLGSTMNSKYQRPLSEWTIGIVNQLSSNQILFAHCKSKDDNLGDHYVEVGQTYKWQFKENMTSTTLFWCTLRTPANLHATFEVFWRERGEWLGSRCNFRACIWYARDDGIYLLNIPQGSYELIHTWEH